MTFISSDTNVWIDFDVLGRLDLPFKLTYTYLMTEITIEEELCSPGLKDQLISLGLQKTELSPEEFALVLNYEQKYLQLTGPVTKVDSYWNSIQIGNVIISFPEITQLLTDIPITAYAQS